MTHAEIQERLPLLALGEIELADARQVESHVAGCEACRAELLELREAFGAIGLSAPPAAPPAALAERIFAAARTRETERPRKTERPPSREREAPSRREAAAPRRPGTGAAGWLGGAVAAAAAAFLLWSDWTLRAERDELRAALEREQRRAARAERQLVATRAQAETAEMELAHARGRAEAAFVAHARERASASLLSNPETRNVTLGGEDSAPQAHGRIAVNQDQSRAILFCAEMPTPPEGMAYQLWFIAGGQPVPGGLFRPEPDGTCIFPDRIPPEGRAADRFVVTLEPEQGVSAPSGKVFLVSAAR